jgi:large subunit ribosomal protein L25
VPGVIYGKKQEALSIQLSQREISNVLASATSEHLVVELEIADGAQTSSKLAIIQEVQHHPLRGNVLHVDFHAVSADETIHAAVPIETVGTANGVKNYGGILETSVHELEVECLPKDLPEVIRIDVSHLGLNEAVHIRDLQLPPGVTARGDSGLTVVRVAPPTVAETESPAGAAAAAQPEVIKEKKEDADKK